MISPNHTGYMHMALRLAHQQLGRTFPNPSVGCVIVKDARIIGIGATNAGGRPHAETIALAMAGDEAKDATLYVTLEPCAHHGKTPPCAEAIITAGIQTVVCACHDPDERTNGQGIKAVRDAGITVVEGICEKEAQELNEGFIRRVQKNRPFITMKLASTLDSKIATASGKSQWITYKPARDYGHLLRSHHEAIVTGIGTVLADNPSLTCRLAGLEQYSPIRVVLDSKLQLPEDGTLAQTAKDTPTWVMTAENLAASDKAKALEKADVKIIACPLADEHLDLAKAIELLAQEGISRLMVEAGAELSTAFLKAKLVDQLYWFRAAKLIGADGLDAIAALPDIEPNQLESMRLMERISLGADQCDVYRVSPCLPVS